MSIIGALICSFFILLPTSLLASDKLIPSYLSNFSSLVVMNNSGIRITDIKGITGELVQPFPDKEVVSKNNKDLPTSSFLQSSNSKKSWSYRLVNTTMEADVFISFMEVSEKKPLLVTLNIGLPSDALELERQLHTVYEAVAQELTIGRAKKQIFNLVQSKNLELFSNIISRQNYYVQTLPGVFGEHTSVAYRLNQALTSDTLIRFIQSFSEFDFRPKPKYVSPERDRLRIALKQSGHLDQLTEARNDKEAEHLGQMPMNTYRFFYDLIASNQFLSSIFMAEDIKRELAKKLSEGVHGHDIPATEDVIIDYEKELISNGRFEGPQIEKNLSLNQQALQVERRLDANQSKAPSCSVVISISVRIGNN